MGEFIFLSKRIADFLINICDQDGVLPNIIDLQTNVTNGLALSDLGDYAPFIYWLGEITYEKPYQSYAKYQVNAVQGFLSRKRVYSTNEFPDILLGVLLIYELSGNKKYLSLFEKLVGFVEKTFFEGGYLHAYNIFGRKVYISYSGYTGSIIEEMCRAYEFTGKEKFLEKAVEFSKPWIESKGFSDKGLFFPYSKGLSGLLWIPAKLFAGIDSKTAIIMKPNTNMIFGLLKLYEVTKDRYVRKSLDRWLKTVCRYSRDGFFFSLINSHGEGKVINLETNHAVMEVFLTAYHHTKKKDYLDVAKRTAEAWLSLRDQKTNLIRNTPESTLRYFSHSYGIPFLVKTNGNVSRLDPSVDFIINLLRLYDVTRNKKYLNLAEEITHSIIRYHSYKEAFVDMVSLNNLKPLSTKIECKYLGLFIKGLLTLHHVKSGERIFKNPKIMNLIRDR